MSDRQPHSDPNFKTPSPQSFPHNRKSPGSYRGQHQQMAGGRGFHNQGPSTPGSGGHYGNQNRNNIYQEGWNSAPSPGNRRERRDRSHSGDRHRSNSSGRDARRNSSGGGSGGRNSSRDRQSDNGNERRYSQEESDSWEEQGNQSWYKSPQSNKQWEGQWGDQSWQQSQQYDGQWNSPPQNYRGRGQSRQFYGHDNRYNQDDGYSRRGGRNWGGSNSPEKGGRGGRGGRHSNAGYGGGGQARDMNRYRGDDSDVFLSKTLSSILRHNAEKFGFKLMKGGFLYVDDILQYVQKLRGFTLEDVTRIVDSNDKKRFALEEEGGRVKIRANQGHSLEVEELDLQPVLSADEAPIVMHGTYYSSWELIKKTGLHRMNRNHIHFAAGEPGESGVISGMRKTCEVMIHINMEKALKDGLKFYRSANNVILCEGDKDGIIYPCYFQGVLDRIHKHLLPFDDKISSTTAEEKPQGSKKRKKKSKGKNKEEEAAENMEEVTEELKAEEVEDGATTDDTSLPAAKKQHVNDSEPLDKPGASEPLDKPDDSEPLDKPDAKIVVEETASVKVKEDIDEDSETDEAVKSIHWNELQVVKDVAESQGIVEHWCSNPPSHIAVCCVGQNLGTKSSRIQAVVISAHPDCYMYYLRDDTSLVKDGHLEQLLMNKDICKVFHDIGAVSTSLINEYDILMDGMPIWDIKMVLNNVSVAEMDLEELKFEKKIFKKWTNENEEFGKKMAAQYDPAVASELVERGKLMWDLYRLCSKKVEAAYSKKLRKEIFQAAIPSSEDSFLAEKIKALKLEKKGKGKKTAEKTEEKSQQQPQEQQEEKHGKGKSGKGKGGKGKKR